MNLVIITGNVTKVWDNGNNVKISVADNYKEYTTYIPVMCFNTTADWVRRYISTGDHIAIHGTVGTYKGNDRNEHTSIIAHRITFEGYKNPNKRLSSNPTHIPTTTTPPANEAFEPFVSDDIPPFDEFDDIL